MDQRSWYSVGSWELRLAASAVRCKLLGQSDYDRWTQVDNLSASWDQRTRKIAELVPPNSKVLEFGAGRRQLAKYLHPSCQYFASDLAGDPSQTLICDLNRRPFPQFQPHEFDAAVFSGVLEYVRDLPGVVQWLSTSFPICIASYACSGTRPRTVRRLLASASRMRHGWVSTFS